MKKGGHRAAFFASASEDQGMVCEREVLWEAERGDCAVVCLGPFRKLRGPMAPEEPWKLAGGGESPEKLANISKPRRGGGMEPPKRRSVAPPGLGSARGLKPVACTTGEFPSALQACALACDQVLAAVSPASEASSTSRRRLRPLPWLHHSTTGAATKIEE